MTLMTGHKGLPSGEAPSVSLCQEMKSKEIWVNQAFHKRKGQGKEGMGVGGGGGGKTQGDTSDGWSVISPSKVRGS